MLDNLEKSYFELFGIPESFDVNVAGLTSRYQDLQRQFHPDKFGNASDHERRLSMQLAAHINEALQTLKDPVQRGRYLLQQAGVLLNDETDTQMNPEFLMGQIELREDLESAKGAPDVLKECMALQQKVEQNQQARLAKLSELFSEKSEESYHRARELLREMQFLQKMMSQIEALEESIV